MTAIWTHDGTMQPDVREILDKSIDAIGFALERAEREHLADFVIVIWDMRDAGRALTVIVAPRENFASWPELPNLADDVTCTRLRSPSPADSIHCVIFGPKRVTHMFMRSEWVMPSKGGSA